MGQGKARPLAVARVLGGLARLISGVQIRWQGSRPDPRQRIYFANHTSHLDSVVLWASLPVQIRSRVRPVAARDYWIKSPLRRYLSKEVFRAVLINRAPDLKRDGFRAGEAVGGQMVEAMGERDSLLVFPEGTRGAGQEVGEFKGGLYHLCLCKPGVELIPVYLENLNRILPKGEVLPVPILSRVTFGPAFSLEPNEPKRAFLKRARAAVCALKEA